MQSRRDQSQGSAPGPLLFLVYMNDLPNSSDILKAILFADDSTIYASDTSLPNLITTVNKELNTLPCWFIANKMSLNITKTKYIILGRKRKITDTHVTMNRIEMEQVSHTKFLSIIIDEQLDWTEHINSATKKYHLLSLL